LPGVASVFGSYLKSSSTRKFDAELPPAEREAEGRGGAANIYRQAALVAWVAQRDTGIVADDLELGALERGDDGACGDGGDVDLWDEVFARFAENSAR
jgi:hypothetical protein